MSVWKHFCTTFFDRVLHCSGAACRASDKLCLILFTYLF